MPTTKCIVWCFVVVATEAVDRHERWNGLKTFSCDYSCQSLDGTVWNVVEVDGDCFKVISPTCRTAFTLAMIPHIFLDVGYESPSKNRFSLRLLVLPVPFLQIIICINTYSWINSIETVLYFFVLLNRKSLKFQNRCISNNNAPHMVCDIIVWTGPFLRGRRKTFYREQI